jgi:hypothetical protein
MFGVQFLQVVLPFLIKLLLPFSLPEDGLPLYLTSDIPSHLT